MGKSYQELNSNNYQEEVQTPKDDEKSDDLGEFCSHAYMEYRKYPGWSERYDIHLQYKEDAFMVCNTAIQSISCRSEDANLEIHKFLLESRNKKTTMDLVDFREFMVKFEDLRNVRIQWELGEFQRDHDLKEWSYEGKFYVDGEKKRIWIRMDEEDVRCLSIFSGLIQCKSYEDFEKMLNKCRLLGIMPEVVGL